MSKFHLMNYNLLETSQKMFAFDVYIYNKANDKYILFLTANSPFSEQMRSIYKILISKEGNKLAIKDGQQLTFQRALEIEKEKALGLSETIESEYSQPASAPTKDRGVEVKTSPIKSVENKPNQEKDNRINEKIISAFDEDNFMELIHQVQTEVSAFPLTISPTVSLAVEFSNKLLGNDTKFNRIACVSYLLARFSGIADAQALAELFNAAIIQQTGLTQMRLEISRTPIRSLDDRKLKQFKKLEGLSQHLVRKTNLQLSPRCLKIILECRERIDGSGYPNMKKSPHIEPLALILGCVTHLFDFYDGSITGKKTSIWTTINCLENRTPLPGLEFQFGDQSIDNLVYMIKKRLSQQAA